MEPGLRKAGPQLQPPLTPRIQTSLLGWLGGETRDRRRLGRPEALEVEGLFPVCEGVGLDWADGKG